MSNYGFKRVNNILNPTPIPNLGINNELLTVVRVKSIVLDKNHPRFEDLGGWDALGTIEFENVIKPNVIYPLPTAKPLYGNIKNYPLVNEVVYLLSLPSTLIGQITSNTISYYINTVALWNHPHHNAYPSNSNEQPPTQQKGYNQTELGNTSKITDQTLEINLGNTFVERSDIHPLLPFEGDVIYEGRWGNSIRLGSTITTKPPIINPLNNWSNLPSTSGDPIIILRNGQGEQTKEGWVPIVEDINNDNSSIYITSTQNIPLKVPNTNYDSYKIAPISPDKYFGKQVIINSGRLVFNSSEDHILLSSAQTIGFNAVKGFNFDTKKANFVINAPSIKLGGKDATESMIKGNSLIIELQSLLRQIQLLSTALQAIPYPQVTAAAQLVLSELPKISANLEKTKSVINKLK
jgi:hypothetical protein